MEDEDLTEEIASAVAALEASMPNLRERAEAAAKNMQDAYERLNDTIDRFESILQSRYQTEGVAVLEECEGVLFYGPLKGHWCLYVHRLGASQVLKSCSLKTRMAALGCFPALYHDIADQDD